MALAEKHGVDRKEVMNLLSSSIFDCLIYKVCDSMCCCEDCCKCTYNAVLSGVYKSIVLILNVRVMSGIRTARFGARPQTR
jgi:hypothetical protein